VLRRHALLIGAGVVGLAVLARPLLIVLRFLDSAICAQLPTHELYLGGTPLPLCARDTGIYTGAALASPSVRWFLALLPTGILLMALALITFRRRSALD